jgi:hypothetical protein
VRIYRRTFVDEHTLHYTTPDQIINTSIDDTFQQRVLLAGHPHNARHWYRKLHVEKQRKRLVKDIADYPALHAAENKALKKRQKEAVRETERQLLALMQRGFK